MGHKTVVVVAAAAAVVVVVDAVNFMNSLASIYV